MEKLIIKETDLKMDIYFIHILLKFNKIKLSAKNYIQKNAEKTFNIIAMLSILICFSLIIYEHRNYFFSIIGVLTIITAFIVISSCIYLKSFKRFSPVYKRNIHLLINNAENDSQIIGNIDNDLISLDKDLEIKLLEEKFKLFFNDSKYEEFKKIAIEKNILDENLKWKFSKKGQKYPVVLFHFLSEINIIKNIELIEIKKYCHISNAMFGLNIGNTMYSKPSYKKIREKEFNMYYKEFLIFS